MEFPPNIVLWDLCIAVMIYGSFDHYWEMVRRTDRWQSCGWFVKLFTAGTFVNIRSQRLSGFPTLFKWDGSLHSCVRSWLNRSNKSFKAIPCELVMSPSYHSLCFAVKSNWFLVIIIMRWWQPRCFSERNCLLPSSSPSDFSWDACFHQFYSISVFSLYLTCCTSLRVERRGHTLSLKTLKSAVTSQHKQMI